MESAISQFTYLPSSKEERATFVTMCVEEIESGTRNPLELELMLKNLEETISAIRKHDRVKALVLSEAQKYPERTISFHGAQITKTGRSAYDFSGCNDSAYSRMIAEQEELKAKIKERETFLKTIKPGIEVADAETGEMLNPPTVTYTESLTIKLP